MHGIHGHGIDDVRESYEYDVLSSVEVQAWAWELPDTMYSPTGQARNKCPSDNSIRGHFAD